MNLSTRARTVVSIDRYCHEVTPPESLSLDEFVCRWQKQVNLLPRDDDELFSALSAMLGLTPTQILIDMVELEQGNVYAGTVRFIDLLLGTVQPEIILEFTGIMQRIFFPNSIPVTQGNALCATNISLIEALYFYRIDVVCVILPTHNHSTHAITFFESVGQRYLLTNISIEDLCRYQLILSPHDQDAPHLIYCTKGDPHDSE
jgi:hypothetical protein